MTDREYLLEKWLSECKNYDSNHPDDTHDAQNLLSTVRQILASGNGKRINAGIWHTFLHVTGKTAFLQRLDNREQRDQWAEAVFEIIRISEYTLKDMFEQRVIENPDRVLFQDMISGPVARWSYKQIHRHIREIAAAFRTTAPENPRVAIFSENCVESACCDLACLFYDIVSVPLNVHFQADVLVQIFNQLRITIAVTDTENRRRFLEKIRRSVDVPFVVFVLSPTIQISGKKTLFLGEFCKQLSPSRIKDLLENRIKIPLNQVATVMYTSGSTGMPKGISFSIYNLVTKRFARAAALPKVGDNEVLVCYLPLYHTFGRFLEMLGTIFWNGTYVFTANPSAETLLSLFPKVQPTGFISIPLRWVQIQEKCLARMSAIPDPQNQHIAFREVVGSRLHWGLSAAGYLDPKVFRFFQRNGVELCSGFGMTEATGGITMTPPGEYEENSTGIPLPGIRTKLSKKGELSISGPYVARYLDESALHSAIPYPDTPENDYWLATGDLFQISETGHFQIVDRIKDIYKNNKGQTIAPRKIEQKFEGVPGIKRTFLVGDGKSYNVLFIVPDTDSTVYQGFNDAENQRDYFHQLIITANRDLAPYERVINFTILERDFTVERKELTPKGSYNRKTIEKHFSSQIEELYHSHFISLPFKNYKIQIPRWFFRDLGLLEDDLQICEEGLCNRLTEQILPLHKEGEKNTVHIGDLEYRIEGDIIDIGLFSRQPRLWIGNPSLISFYPCKEGWDLPLDTVSPRAFRPWKVQKLYTPKELPSLKWIRDHHIASLNQWISQAMFCRPEIAREAVEKMGELLRKADERAAEILRMRLEALSRHPEENIRCIAYRVLLLEEPSSDYSRSFPAFVQSGLTFLNQESMEAIAFSKLEKRQLEALRQRLFEYRVQLEWPIHETTRQQFVKIFQLLSNFTQHHPEFYNPVRAELASWILHKSDSKLAKEAEKYFFQTSRNYETKLSTETLQYSPQEWKTRLYFEDGLSNTEMERVKQILMETTFLKQSILLAFDEKTFDLKDVPHRGIWISQLPAPFSLHRYRLSVNTKKGKHFNLQLILRENFEEAEVLESIHWLMRVTGYPYGNPVLPRLGCYRPELGARSVAYLGELTVWERIRQFASIHLPGKSHPRTQTWQKIFIPALAAFFQGWRNSGYQIVPGAVSPNNVVVPALDFREGAMIESITGWSYYKNTLSLVEPMLQNFYFKTAAHYPWFEEDLEVTWIFDACIEALGVRESADFFTHLQEDLKKSRIRSLGGTHLSQILNGYLLTLKKTTYIPLPVYKAIERYFDWEKINPSATPNAKEQTIFELYNLYRLQRFPELIRYYLFRYTFYGNAEKNVIQAFDRLINKMMSDTQTPAIERIELSDLQGVLTHRHERTLFSRMVFPRLEHRQHLDVLKIGKDRQKQVLIQAYIKDNYGNQYIFREPIEPIEIGQLYRLFFKDDFTITISEQDKYFVICDTQDRIIGGLCYRFIKKRVVFLEGSIVASPLREKGIGSSMIKTFFEHLTGQGVTIIKTHFLLIDFYLHHGFQVDKRYGALVKFLTQKITENTTNKNEILLDPEKTLDIKECL